MLRYLPDMVNDVFAEGSQGAQKTKEAIAVMVSEIERPLPFSNGGAVMANVRRMNGDLMFKREFSMNDGEIVKSLYRLLLDGCRSKRTQFATEARGAITSFADSNLQNRVFVFPGAESSAGFTLDLYQERTLPAHTLPGHIFMRCFPSSSAKPCKVQWEWADIGDDPSKICGFVQLRLTSCGDENKEFVFRGPVEDFRFEEEQRIRIGLRHNPPAPVSHFDFQIINPGASEISRAMKEYPDSCSWWISLSDKKVFQDCVKMHKALASVCSFTSISLLSAQESRLNSDYLESGFEVDSRGGASLAISLFFLLKEWVPSFANDRVSSICSGMPL